MKSPSKLVFPYLPPLTPLLSIPPLTSETKQSRVYFLCQTPRFLFFLHRHTNVDLTPTHTKHWPTGKWVSTKNLGDDDYLCLGQRDKRAGSPRLSNRSVPCSLWKSAREKVDSRCFATVWHVCLRTGLNPTVAPWKSRLKLFFSRMAGVQAVSCLQSHDSDDSDGGQEEKSSNGKDRTSLDDVTRGRSKLKIAPYVPV